MATLVDFIQRVRDFVNESGLNAKYTDAKILREIESAYSLVIPELFMVGGSFALVNVDIKVVSGQASYALPPHVGQILRLAKVDGNGNIQWDFTPRSVWNPAGYGVRVNPPNIVFDPPWQRGETLRLTYLPTGEIRLAEGPLDAASTASSLVLGTPTKGALGTHQEEYAGYNVTLTDANGDQETLFVDSSSRAAGAHTLTVMPSATLSVAATTTYEVVPVVSEAVKTAVVSLAAKNIAGREGRQDREAGILRQYQLHIRQLMLQHGNIENILGQHFTADTFDNDRFAGSRFSHFRTNTDGTTTVGL